MVNQTPTPYYDLMGRPVANPTRGIYIKDGKKIAVDWQQSSDDNVNDDVDTLCVYVDENDDDNRVMGARLP